MADSSLNAYNALRSDEAATESARQSRKKYRLIDTRSCEDYSVPFSRNKISLSLLVRGDDTLPLDQSYDSCYIGYKIGKNQIGNNGLDKQFYQTTRKRW